MILTDPVHHGIRVLVQYNILKRVLDLASTHINTESLSKERDLGGGVINQKTALAITPPP